MDIATAIILFTVFLGLLAGLTFRWKGLAVLLGAIALAAIARMAWIELSGGDASGLFGLYLVLIYTVPLLSVVMAFSGLLGIALRGLLDHFRPLRLAM